MDGQKIESSEIINVLLKGENLPDNRDYEFGAQDEYLQEFSSKSLTATIISPLQFNYINIDRLKDILIELTSLQESDNNQEQQQQQQQQHQLIGLIISSPRVVEAIAKAFNCMNDRQQKQIVQNLNSNYVFPVAQKTANDLKQKLSIDYNCDAANSGDGQKLAEFIGKFCNNYNKSNDNNDIKLIYPKGSLASQTIEEHLSKCPNLNIIPITVYETKVVDNLCDRILKKLSQNYQLSILKRPNLDIIDHNLQSQFKYINFIFFSPSGVRGFKIEYNKLKAFLEQNKVGILFSSIGRTTEKALRENGFKVLCVTEQPNAKSLADCLVKTYCCDKI